MDKVAIDERAFFAGGGMSNSPLIFCFTFLVAIAQDSGHEVPELGRKLEDHSFDRVPIRDCVTEIRFSRDGSESWCLAGWRGTRRGNDRGRAFVFAQSKNSWVDIPRRSDPAAFNDAAFSGDGTTTWIAMSSDENRRLRVRQRLAESEDWQDLDGMPEDYNVVERIWLTPNSRELWMYTSDCGLVRKVLNTDKSIQYVRSDYRRFDGISHLALIGDYVLDVVFTSDSEYAICFASGGDSRGLTKINLKTDELEHFPISDAPEFKQLVLAPNNTHVWCIGSRSYLWCLDIQSGSWIHKSTLPEPLRGIDSLVCSRDSRHVWISGSEGVACYSVENKTWIAHTGPEWHSTPAMPLISTVPIVATSDGRSVIAGHASGLAVFEIDGDLIAKIECDEPTVRSTCTQLVPIPNTSDYLCSLEFDGGRGGLYVLKSKTRSLGKLFRLNAPVTALAVSPSNRAWIAVPACIYELDLSKRLAIQKHSIAADQPAKAKAGRNQQD